MKARKSGAIRQSSNANRLLCLVTGGAGFIGSHLVKLLLSRGNPVRVLDLKETPDADENAEFVRGSILDRQTLRDCLGGVDHVYHLAADPNLWATNKNSFMETNFEGTRLVLEEAERANVKRIIHTSTESILKGMRGTDCEDPTNEKTERTLKDMPGPYCRSKFLAETEALAAAARGVPVVIVNPTLPVGPGDYRITPPTRMLLDFLNGKSPAYLDFWMNMIDVRDIALGQLLAAEKGRVGQRYILGHQNLRLSEVLNMITELTGLPMPRTRVSYCVAFCFALLSEFVADNITHKSPRAPLTGVRLAKSSMRFDCAKAHRELGLAPRPLRNALLEAIIWLKEKGKIQREIRDFHEMRDKSTLAPSSLGSDEGAWSLRLGQSRQS